MSDTPPAGPENPLTQRKTAVWAVTGTILGLLLLYAATRKVEVEPLLLALRAVDLRFGAGLLAATAGFVALKAWRWKLLLLFVPGLRYRQLHAATYVGLAMNFLVAHTGEFLRAAAVARYNAVSFSSVFATVLVERSLDFIALLMLLCLVAVATDDLPPFVDGALLLTGVFAALGVAALYALSAPPAWLSALLTRLGRPMPARVKSWLVTQLTLSRKGLVALENVRRMILALALSVIQWLLVLLAIWCSVRAVGAGAGVVPIAATFVLLIVGLMLPNSPMQIGTTQLAFTIGLGTGNISATVAIAASLIYTLFLILPIMLIGSLCLVQVRGNRGLQTHEPAS